MNDTKLKYVRLPKYDVIIIFPQILEHSDFKHMCPVSAGFCYIGNGEVNCFGNSFSLGIDSNKEDSKHATRQVFGIDAMLNLI